MLSGVKVCKATVSIKRNAVANYVGQGWAAAMGLAFIPTYIHYLGIEAWGLVGFMSMMQAWLSLLDMGFTPTLSREMARFTAGVRSPESIRNLLRTMELVYGAVALLITIVVWCIAPWLATDWLKLGSLPESTVVQAIGIIGMVLASRMAEQVYRGAIQGLQHHVWLNSAQAILATLRWVGAVCVLAWLPPTIEAFFIWQGSISLVSLVVLAVRTYRWLPPPTRPTRFDVNELKQIQRFASGMALTTFLALLLTQIDKLVLSKLLPLDQFGYYILATSVSGALTLLVSPLIITIAPRLTELIARGDVESVIVTYRRAYQWLAVIVVPPSLILAAYAQTILLAWTGDLLVARSAAPVLSVLAVGTMLNGFMNVPYAAQLAYGWTGFVVRLNAVAVAIFVPMILWVVPHYGPIGAAWVWLGLNLAYVAVGMHFMHKRILMAEKWRWYRTGVLTPTVTAVVIICIAKVSVPLTHSRVLNAAIPIFVGFVTLLAIILVTREPRAYLLRHKV